MNAFHFLRPEWLFALPAVALWVLVYWYQRRGDGGWQKSVDAHLLRVMLHGRSTGVRRTCLMIAFLGVVSVLALAGPSWQRSDIPVNRDGQARVFVLDMSLSMNATDLRPSRMAQARLKLVDLLDASQGHVVALIGFAAFPYTLTPLTDDINTLKSIAALIDPNMSPAQGADIALALARASDLIRQAFAEGGEIVLISDSVPSKEALAEAASLARTGLQVNVLSLGADELVSVPFGQGYLQDSTGQHVQVESAHAGLKALAVAGNGRFVALQSGAIRVESVLSDHSGPSAEDVNEGKVTTVWRDDGAWLLWLSLLPIVWLSRKGVVC